MGEPQVGVPGAPPAPAEPATGDPKPPQTVPLERFEEVNEERKEAQEKRVQLERDLAEARVQLRGYEASPQPQPAPEPGQPAPVATPNPQAYPEIPNAPEGLTPGQRVNFYVRHGMEQNLGAVLEKIMGVPVAQQKALFANGPQMLDNAANRGYEVLCQTAVVDPLHAGARAAFIGLTHEGVEGPAAIAKVKEMFGDVVAPKAAPEPKASQIRTGATVPMATENIFPTDKAHAVQLALEGKRVRECSVDEAFEVGRKRRNALTTQVAQPPE